MRCDPAPASASVPYVESSRQNSVSHVGDVTAAAAQRSSELQAESSVAHLESSLSNRSVTGKNGLQVTTLFEASPRPPSQATPAAAPDKRPQGAFEYQKKGVVGLNGVEIECRWDAEHAVIDVEPAVDKTDKQ
mmetsp:Transcript_8870/g.22478  ORF Transcript_8870/g.22478 Transcript_8870/m.22478 type:complete len:133 (-) Transcript_8870:224-622(-)